MAETMTLEELKAKNLAQQEEAQEPEEAEDTQLEAEPEEEVTDSEEGKEPKPDEETESWMQEDESSPSDDSTGFKPNREAAAVRKKLRAKIHEKDDELEQLKAKVAQYETGQVQAQQAPSLPPRPKLEDYDWDEGKYDEALDSWYDSRAEAKARQVMTTGQTDQQKRELAEKQKAAMDEAVNSHYERAYKLVSEGKVSEEKYTQADRAVRESFERLAKGSGDKIVDTLIKTLNSLGDGSEKVMYQLGVNPGKMQELQNLYTQDPSGLTAVAYLGKLQANITTPNKRKSSAPAPSPELSGSGSGKTAESALKQQYSKASNNLQKRIDLKREAKRNGIDTSKW